jgi:hypothetical protein
MAWNEAGRKTRRENREAEDARVLRMVEGYNLLRDALVWFESHEVEKKLGHLPQWVDMAKKLISSDKRSADK